MGGTQVQSLTPTPPKHFGLLKGGGGGGHQTLPRAGAELRRREQTTFVPICPHGGERSMWPQNQKCCTNPALFGAQQKC